MHFIVTGGAGFIGSHLTNYLLAEGHHVTVVDDLTSGKRQNLSEHRNLTLMCQDILQCQPEAFTQPVAGLVHLAATPSVTQSWLNPLSAHQNNLTTTVAVLQLAQALKIQRLVYASSAAVYGNPTQLPITEDHVTDPISPYGLQKLVSEQYIQMFAQHCGFSAVILRLFNVFGPRQLPNSPYSGAISIFVEAMRQGRPITLFGDGRQTRDFVYVQDVALAIAQSLTVTMPAKANVVCNIGTGTSVTLLALIEILRHYFPSWKADVNFAPERVGDIRHSQPCIAKASAALRFVPTWSVPSALELLIQSLNSPSFQQSRSFVP